LAISIIKTDKAPAAIGPYSQAVQAGNLLFLSGQLGLDPQSGNLVSDQVEAQARQAMQNLQAVLEAAGLNFSHVAETTIYLVDMADFQAVNTIYAEAMGAYRPARVTVGVASLPKNGKVEIKMTAVSA